MGIRDVRRIRASMRLRQIAPVPLQVAASLVYFQLRRNVSARNGDELDRSLNDAALALAQIADIYYENDAGRILRIPDEDLRNGLFTDGAKTFASTTGHEYRGLSIRRIDVMHAMETLEKADQALSVAARPVDASAGTAAQTPKNDDHAGD